MVNVAQELYNAECGAYGQEAKEHFDNNLRDRRAQTIGFVGRLVGEVDYLNHQAANGYNDQCPCARKYKLPHLQPNDYDREYGLHKHEQAECQLDE